MVYYVTIDGRMYGTFLNYDAARECEENLLDKGLDAELTTSDPNDCQCGRCVDCLGM